MKTMIGPRCRAALCGFAGLITAGAVRADVWQAVAGAQSSDQGKQVLAFLSNEHWIHVGDSIVWSFPVPKIIHTVTFLTPGQVRPPFPVGCPGSTPSGSSFTGANCVNSGTLMDGATYTVTFPVAGNFKLVCLVHSRMTGTVHVLPVSQMLPYDRAFYDRQAENQRVALLSESAEFERRAAVGGSEDELRGRVNVIAGMSSILGTAGGAQTAALMRFVGANIVVRVGDTVEWANPSRNVVHTITFGTEPANPVPPSPNITVDADGVGHAVISSPNDSVNSGLLVQENQETIGFPQWPLDITRFRITFTAPGVFNYICAIHDVVGMVGQVEVVP